MTEWGEPDLSQTTDHDYQGATYMSAPEYTRDDHRWMILHQDEWPLWPKLPLKRGFDNSPSMGFIIGTAIEGEINPEARVRVYLGLLTPSVMDVDESMHLDYDNLDCLLDAGWVVD